MKKGILSFVIALAGIALIPAGVSAADTDTVKISNLGDCASLDDGTNVQITFNDATIIMLRYTSTGFKGYIADSSGGIELGANMISAIFIELGYTEGKTINGGPLNGTINITDGVPVFNTNSSSGRASSIPVATTADITPTAVTISTVEDSSLLCTLVQLTDVSISELTVSGASRWFTIADYEGNSMKAYDVATVKESSTSYVYITDDLMDDNGNYVDTDLESINGVLALTSSGEFVLYPTEFEVETVPAAKNIAAAIALGDNAEARMIFSDAYVTALRSTASGKLGFIEDATGAMAIGKNMMSSIFTEYDMTEGTKLSGGLLFGLISESDGISSFEISDLTGSRGTLPTVTSETAEPTKVTISEANDTSMLCHFVSISDVTISAMASGTYNWFYLTDADGNTIKAHDIMIGSGGLYLTDELLDDTETTYNETALKSITGIIYAESSEIVLYPTDFVIDTIATVQSIAEAIALGDDADIRMYFNEAYVTVLRNGSDDYIGFIEDETGAMEIDSEMITGYFNSHSMTEGTQLDGGPVYGQVSITDGVPSLCLTSLTSTSSTQPTVTDAEAEPTVVTVAEAVESSLLCHYVTIENATLSALSDGTSYWFTLTDWNGDTIKVHDIMTKRGWTGNLTDAFLDGSGTTYTDVELESITGIIYYEDGEQVLYPTAYVEDTIPTARTIAQAQALEDGTELRMLFNDAVVTAIRYTADNTVGYIEDATGAMCVSSTMINSIFIEYGLTEGSLLNGGPLYGQVTCSGNMHILTTSTKTGSYSSLPTVTSVDVEPTEITIAQAQDAAYIARYVKISDVTISALEDSANWFTLTDADGNSISVYDYLLKEDSSASYVYITEDLADEDGTYPDTELESITGIISYAGSQVLLPTDYVAATAEEDGDDDTDDDGDDTGDGGEDTGDDNGEDTGDGGEDTGDDNGEDTGDDGGEDTGDDNGEDTGDGGEDTGDDGDDTDDNIDTGITSVNTTEALSNENIYTISGVKVNSTTLDKGVYIINGKKIVVK